VRARFRGSVHVAEIVNSERRRQHRSRYKEQKIRRARYFSRRRLLMRRAEGEQDRSSIVSQSRIRILNGLQVQARQEHKQQHYLYPSMNKTHPRCVPSVLQTCHVHTNTNTPNSRTSNNNGNRFSGLNVSSSNSISRSSNEPLRVKPAMPQIQNLSLQSKLEWCANLSRVGFDSRQGLGGIIDPLQSEGSLVLSQDSSFLFAANPGSGTITTFRVVPGT
jgi:hypothetical protein